MEKNKKQKTILESSLNERWPFSFAVATFGLIFLLVIFPQFNNPILKPIFSALQPVGFIACGFFYLIALIKFAKEDKVKSDSLLDIKNEPTLNSPSSEPVIPTGQIGFAEQLALVWSLKLIQELEWKRFEELSLAYYLEKNIRAETTSLGADGGIDIKLFQDDSGNPTTIIQCKSWASQVTVKQVREFLGVMTHEKIAKGFYMTSSRYTNDAIEFAKANRITLINGEMLLMMIQRLTIESQQKLLALATSGNYRTPSCPSCGIKMAKRPSKNGGFWGCLNFPKGCKQKLHLRSVDR